jgi:macrolide phosphotransferase
MIKTDQFIINLASEHNLHLQPELEFNEMGADFLVAFAKDTADKKWVLRIPRRDNLAERITLESRILQLVAQKLTVSVPEWQIETDRLIAYPLLDAMPALTYDATTYEVHWNMDKESRLYTPALANVLTELHSISEQEAKEVGVKILSPEAMRQEVKDRIDLVKKEMGMSKELETRWNTWVDNDALWPGFGTFVHGDLYAGHVLTEKDGTIRGIIDWSEAHISDPAIDFAGHSAVFGEESTRDLIHEYERLGGRTWDKLFEQAVERQASSPLNYAAFALQSNDEKHLAGARYQLGVLQS